MSCRMSLTQPFNTPQFKETLLWRARSWLYRSQVFASKSLFYGIFSKSTNVYKTCTLLQHFKLKNVATCQKWLAIVVELLFFSFFSLPLFRSLVKLVVFRNYFDGNLSRFREEFAFLFQTFSRSDPPGKAQLTRGRYVKKKQFVAISRMFNVAECR